MRVALALVTAEALFLRRGHEAVRVSNATAPLTYTSAGCWEVQRSGFRDLSEYDGGRAMTPDTCYTFCRDQPVVPHLGRYFGVKNGRTCWCATLYAAKTRGTCDVDCDGGGGGCGGYTATDVYHIYHCDSPAGGGGGGEGSAGGGAGGDCEQNHAIPEYVPKELEAEYAVADVNCDGVVDGEEEEAVFRKPLYTAIRGSSCGKDPVNVVGQKSMVETEQVCQKHCSDSLECMGFTYDKGLGRCDFTADVEASGIEQGELLSCLTKPMR